LSFMRSSSQARLPPWTVLQVLFQDGINIGRD